MKKETRNMAMSGILSALAVVFLLLGSLIEVFDLSASAMAALVVMVAVIEMGCGRAVGVYAVASTLSLLLMPRTASVVFACFVGYYPILKVYLDKIRLRLVRILLKLVCFNAFLCGILWLCDRVLGIGNGWMELGVLLFLLGNLTFLVFDFAIGRLSIFYIVKIKDRLRKHR